MTADIPIDELRQWIGRTDRAHDSISPRLVKSLRATLDQEPGEARDGETAPLAIHWCLTPAIGIAASIGPDGHPERGGFLPPIPLPRRMWAGSTLEFSDDLRVGDDVERNSRIEDVTLKEGRTGRLCFVTMAHEYATRRGIAVREKQNIVYRELDSRQPPPPPAETTQPQWRQQVLAEPVLLFRYSALTFNGHRIHYDRTYCIEEEGYPGLIVHGPLQATLLLQLAAATRDGQTPRRFEFRGINPLFDGAEFSVNAIAKGEERELWVANHQAQKTMVAQASW